jgi:uroporphyrinogen decarboxylase
MNNHPYYRRLLKTIHHEEPDRVPLAEFQVDTYIKNLFMGRPIRDVGDHVAFQAAAGFDFIYLRADYEFEGLSPVVSTGTPRSWESSATPHELESVSTDQPGPIQTLADFDAYAWPDPRTVDVSPLEMAAAALPTGMGIITGVGGVFTRTWMILGYPHFCLSLNDTPELVERVAEQVGRTQCEVLRRLVRMPGVFAVWYGDDLAFTEGLLVSPKILRRWFFPWMEELAGIARQAGMPFIMHSDGNLWPVLDDLISLGVEALHPIEPKAMDIYDLKRRYGHRVAIFGNIDMGYRLVPGEGRPEDVRAEVRQRIKDLAPGGGYAVASGAGVTRYVTLENFNAMREATLEYGVYPIRL